MSQDYRVLSIQSHVVSGYVGNKSATFPLQTLGFEVDAINTVQFSNHTGYGKFKGQIISPQDFDDLIEGLRQNDLLSYTHVLTGYCRSAEMITRIAKKIRVLKEKNPSLMYVCDPVLGDNGHMYVPEEVLPILRDELSLLADVICPNHFEAELLTNIPIRDKQSLFQSIDVLHTKGIKTVVISSSELGLPNHLFAVASTTVGKKKTAVSIDIPKFNIILTGTGDLFASLILGWLTKTNHDVKQSLEKTIATLQSIIEKTLSKYKDSSTELNCKERELKIVQCKADIENPEVKIQAQLVEHETKEFL